MADNQQSESEGEFESAESDSEDSTPLNNTSTNPELQPSPQQAAESPQKSLDSKEQKEKSEEHSVSTEETVASATEEDTKSSENVSTSVKVELAEEKENQNNSSSVVSEQVKSTSHHPPTDIQRAQQEDKETEQEAAAGGGWGWGWGGLGNLLSSSVTTVSGSAQAIGRGIGSVVSTMEETLGVPSPQELVVEEKEDEEKLMTKKENSEEEESAPDASKQDTQADQEQDATSPSFGGFWTGLTSAVQSTGMGIVSGGLDALETIGRKTVDLISEGDPGLQNKRAMLRGRGAGGGSTLAQLLKEAKERVELSKEEDDEDSTKKEVNYSILLDESGGLVHFEALELLSKECSSKLRTEMSGFVGEELDEMRKGHKELSLLFKKVEEEESEEEENRDKIMEEVKQLLQEMRVKVKLDKLLEVIDQSKARITAVTGSDKQSEGEEDKETEKPAAELLYEDGLRSLAELSTASIELLRKIAELSLIHSDDNKDVQQKADKLCKVVLLFMRQLEDIANQFAEQITALQSEAEVTDSRVTTIYLEASNSCSYIQDAFQLLLPILQLQMIHLQSSAPQ